MKNKIWVSKSRDEYQRYFFRKKKKKKDQKKENILIESVKWSLNY